MQIQDDNQQIDRRDFKCLYTVADEKFLNQMKNLSPNAVKVYLALMARTNPTRDEGEYIAYPNKKTIMYNTGIKNKSTVTKSISELKKYKFIIAIRKGGRNKETGENEANIYTLEPPVLPVKNLKRGANFED